MFNPSQTKLWREALEREPRLTEYEGYHCHSARLTLDTDLTQEAETNDVLGTFYPPARILGAPLDPSCLNGIATATIMVPRGRIERLAQARVVGFAALLSKDNQLYTPRPISSAGVPFAVAKNRSNREGFLLLGDGNDLTCRFIGRQEPKCLDMDALFLPNIEPGNYGAFFFRQIPQIIRAQAAQLKFDCYVAERTPVLMQALNLFGLPSRPIFSAREVAGEIFRSIQLCTHSDAEGFLAPIVREALSGVANAANGQEWLYDEPPARIYVSRALSTLSRPGYRPMLNETHIERIAAERGYRVVYPETLSFAAQAKTFSRATQIVGPSGSGMFNTAFAPAGARVLDIETFTVAVRQHAKLYASCGRDYAFAFTPTVGDAGPPHLRAWHLPTQLFSEALDWLEESCA